MRNAADSRGEPAAAEVIFQQSVDSIQIAAERAAGDHQVRPHGADHIAFVAQPRQVDGSPQRFEAAAGAKHDLVAGRRFAVRDHRQLGGGDLLEEGLQFLGRVLGRGRGVGRDDDAVFRLAAVGQDEFAGPRGERRRTSPKDEEAEGRVGSWFCSDGETLRASRVS